MKYNLQWLLAEQNQSKEINYLFFWGHKPAKDNSITKSCFSQWWPSAFIVNGIEYKTAEHWMMAKKAQLFNDIETFAQIITAEKPGTAKALGRKVKSFDADTWDQHAFNIVVEGNQHKFNQHTDLKQFLFETGSKIIVEASPVDKIWGVGMAQDNPNINNPTKWNGKNLLGFALMEVRDLINNQTLNN